jgi:hypothetical protein
MTGLVRKAARWLLMAALLMLMLMLMAVLCMGIGWFIIRPLLRYWEPIAIFVSGYLAGVYVTNHALARQVRIDPKISKILERLDKAIAIPFSLLAAAFTFGLLYVSFSGIWKPLPWLLVGGYVLLLFGGWFVSRKDRTRSNA